MTCQDLPGGLTSVGAPGGAFGPSVVPAPAWWSAQSYFVVKYLAEGVFGGVTMVFSGAVPGGTVDASKR